MMWANFQMLIANGTKIIFNTWEAEIEKPCKINQTKSCAHGVTKILQASLSC